MKNRKISAFLSLAFATSLLIVACNQKPTSESSASSSVEPSSSQSQSTISSDSSVPSSSSISSGGSVSSDSSSSSMPLPKYTVTFKVHGQVVQTSQVEEGEKALYTGETPVKNPDADSFKYEFRGWGAGYDDPITKDTEFNAVFAGYIQEYLIDDFEKYEDTASMMDEGWYPLGYTNSGWSRETKAAVSLSNKSEEGKQSLRFDAWENGVGYKYAKDFKTGEFNKAVNALKFRAMAPYINDFKVILHASGYFAGKTQAVSFTYPVGKLTSSQFVEYIIPFDSDNWQLWNEPGKSIKAVAGWLGIHQDDLLNYITKIEFYLQGSDNTGGQPYMAFLDSARFLTLENPAYEENETMTLEKAYTGQLTNNQVIKLEIGENKAATATVLGDTPTAVPGQIEVDGKDVVFTSADSGATLKYTGKFNNGGKAIKYVSATGQVAALCENVDLNALQVVDNYEQYTADGVAYYASNTIEDRRGCRGNYYSEYYKGSGSSPWGGNNWSLMEGNGDQLKLMQDAEGAHSGNNYLSLKHVKDKAMRYMQWGLFDGSSISKSVYGSKFSFWAKTDGWVKDITVYFYYQPMPTNASRDSYVKKVQFVEEAALTEWKHYEMDLKPFMGYYGFMILVEKNYDLSTNQSYLFIDDVECYTVSPYGA